MSFQTDSTIESSFWRHVPAGGDPVSETLFVNLNAVHYIKASPDGNLVVLYFPQATGVVAPLELRGSIAQAFLADMQTLFV